MNMELGLRWRTYAEEKNCPPYLAGESKRGCSSDFKTEEGSAWKGAVSVTHGPRMEDVSRPRKENLPADLRGGGLGEGEGGGGKHNEQNTRRLF